MRRRESRGTKERDKREEGAVDGGEMTEQTGGEEEGAT